MTTSALHHPHGGPIEQSMHECSAGWPPPAPHADRALGVLGRRALITAGVLAVI